ncbi:MAG: hypothetical protein JXR71_03530 [Bacteroidales bacterium]|nr:hypothetical protein [Bacteroidales bacterium]
MNNRRNFLKSGVLLASGMVVSAPLLAARSKKEHEPRFPGVIYTEDDPGMWDGKQSHHVPQVTIKGNSVTLFTDHPMMEVHYIVRHTLVDKKGKVIGSKTFYPSDEKALSHFDIPVGYHGKLYATSFCNKHDFWLKEFVI